MPGIAIKYMIGLLCIFFFASAQNSTISGTLIGTETGNPVSEAKVVLSIRIATGHGGVNFFERIDSVYTDKAGEYSFTQLAAGFYVIAVTGDKYKPQTKNTDLSNNRNITVNFSLTSASGINAGTLVLVVRDAGDSSAVEGATVLVQADDYQIAALRKYTDSDGSVIYNNLSTGRYTINISKDGYSERTHKIDLGKNVTYTVNVLLGPVTSVLRPHERKKRGIGNEQTGVIFTLTGRKVINSSSDILPASHVIIRFQGNDNSVLRKINLR
ncbi:hypothetical protein CHISP_3171 [Chitinispirillum alkaliphilum]|nr:hypothetical protein CHISP_3171 [Chitinispirillum alkaliphilum]